MTTPTLDELFAAQPLAFGDPLAAWLERYRRQVRTDEPLSIEAMLLLGGELPTDDLSDDEVEALGDWWEELRRRALRMWLESFGDEAAVVALVRAAVGWALDRWRAAPLDGTPHDLARLESLVAAGGTPEALAAYDALPSKGPPPPYIGHLYGAVGSLLRATTRDDRRRWLAPMSELAEAISFAAVTPIGGDAPALADFLSIRSR